MKTDKKTSRLRRAKRTRAKIRQLGTARLTVHRTSKHMYAQVIDAEGKVVANASTQQSVKPLAREQLPKVLPRCLLIAPGFSITAE